MANNMFDLDAYIANHPLLQSITQTTPTFEIYDQNPMANHPQMPYVQPPMVSPQIAIRRVYPSHRFASQRAFIYNGFFPQTVPMPYQEHQYHPINFANTVPSFGMPQQPVSLAVSAGQEVQAPPIPVPPQVISPEMNDTVVGMGTAPVSEIYGGEEEGSLSGDGTMPFIDQLDQPIEKMEVDESDDEDGDNGYDLETLDLALQL